MTYLIGQSFDQWDGQKLETSTTKKKNMNKWYDNEGLLQIMFRTVRELNVWLQEICEHNDFYTEVSVSSTLGSDLINCKNQLNYIDSV